MEREPPENEKLVFVQLDNEMTLVKFDSIYFAEAMGRRIRLVTEERVLENVSIGIHRFIDEVNHPEFRKCHKSYAVNVCNIRTIQKRSNRMWDIYFTDNIFCPLSRTFVKEILTDFRHER